MASPTISSRISLGAALIFAALLPAGCVSVGPDYLGPPDLLPDGLTHFHRADNAKELSGPLQVRWWTALHDPELNRLEEAALATSPDLAAAAARLRQSRAGLHGEVAKLLPSAGGNAAYIAGSGSGSGATSNFDLSEAGFDASWEIDIFGGKRRAVESAAASADVREANFADAQVSLTADVAQAYVSLRDLQNRRALLKSSAELQTKTLGLTRVRLASGTASDLDVQRVQTQVENTQADLVPFESQIAQQLDRLAVLTGEVPGTLDVELSKSGRLPTPPRFVAVSDPATLLRKRPDIRAAERTIEAQNAVIGERVADLFPKVTLLGDLGFGSTDLGQIASAKTFTVVGGPVLQWKPFDFGRTMAAIDQAKAGHEEALANYKSVVLKALGDADTAIARFRVQRKNVMALRRAKASADRAAVLTRERYAGGTTTLIDLLDTERQRLQAEQALAQAEAGLTQDFVALQKSLGLGWSALPQVTASR